VGLIITTKDDDIAEVRTTKGSGVIINGKGVSAIEDNHVRIPVPHIVNTKSGVMKRDFPPTSH